jgi:hypothetical protein
VPLVLSVAILGAGPPSSEPAPDGLRAAGEYSLYSTEVTVDELPPGAGFVPVMRGAAQQALEVDAHGGENPVGDEQAMPSCRPSTGPSTAPPAGEKCA